MCFASLLRQVESSLLSLLSEWKVIRAWAELWSRGLYTMSWSIHWVEIIIGNPMISIWLCQNGNHFPPFRHAHNIGDQKQNWYSYSWMRRMRLLPLALSAHMFIFRCCDSICYWEKHQITELAVLSGFPQWKGAPPLVFLYHASPHWKPSWDTFPALTVFHLSSILFRKYLYLVPVSCPTWCHGPCFWGSCGSMFRICPQKAASYFSF